MSAHETIRRTFLVGVAALAVLGWQMVSSSQSAMALTLYPNTPSAVFGSAGSGEGELSDPIGMAVDESSGDVYVVDSGNDRVEEFDAEGKYLAQITGSKTPAKSFSGPREVAVDNSSSPAKGDVYVADPGNNAIDVFNSSGEYLSQIKLSSPLKNSEPRGVTVDASGDVWVREEGEGYNGVRTEVIEFSDTGELMSRLNYGEIFGYAGPGDGIVVLSDGLIDLMNSYGQIEAYKQAGEGGGELSYGTHTALALDDVTESVFAVAEHQKISIEEFQPFNGSPIDNFGEGSLSSSAEGIAVNGGSGVVYASEGEADTVAVFKPYVVPDVTTGGAGEVKRTSAKLEGVVDPDGEHVTSCQFEYGESEAYGHTAACVPAPGSGSSPVAVSAEVSGLTLASTYHYRLVAADANGVDPGADATFTTSSAVDELQTEAATGVEKSGATIVATLNGSLAPDGVDAHYYFEYGESEAYGSTSPAPPGTDAGEASTLEHVQTVVSLKGGITYHFRIVGTNSFGTSYGADMTFTTPAAVPMLTTQPATEIQGMSATLGGILTPGGVDTHDWFEYGHTASYGSKTPPEDAGDGNEVVVAARPVTGLEPNTTYHYRFIAENTYGVTYGADETLTTKAIVPQFGQPQPVSAITRTAVTVSGSINPEKSLTTYRILYGETSNYGDHSAEFQAGEGYGEKTVQVGLLSLEPGKTYHYAVVVTNQAGTVTGPDETFTTAPSTPPTATTGGASSVALTTATVSGTIDPEGLETSYEIDFGTGPEYGTSLFGEAGSGTGPINIEVPIQYLAPGTTYHYRIVAINSDGRTYGADETFTTPAYSAPIILPSTLPLIATPATAFPTETAPTQKVAKKKTSKKKTTKKKHKKGKGKRKAGRSTKAGHKGRKKG
jgi:hypothetical protein